MESRAQDSTFSRPELFPHCSTGFLGGLLTQQLSPSTSHSRLSRAGPAVGSWASPSMVPSPHTTHRGRGLGSHLRALGPQTCSSSPPPPSSLLPPLPSGVTVQHITRLCPRCDLAPLLPPFPPLPCSCSGLCISYSQYAFCRLSGCDPGSTCAPLNPLPESQDWNLQRRCPQPTLPPVGDPYCFWVGGGATPRRGGCPGSLAAQTK